MILTFLLGERTCALEVTPGRSYDMKLLPTYRLYLFGGGAANALAVQVSPTNIPHPNFAAVKKLWRAPRACDVHSYLNTGQVLSGATWFTDPF